MNLKLLWAAALVLPLAGFGYGWATTHISAQQGEEWLIPVQGYDPRDLLRGHFIQYRYDWPTNKNTYVGGADFPDFGGMCIEGSAPNIVRANPVEGIITPIGKPLPCAIIARATLGTRAEVRGLDQGILYVSQTRARALEEKLRNPRLQGLIRVKIRKDGVMRPVAMEFRPRG